jgi:hypothetical protein
MRTRRLSISCRCPLAQAVAAVAPWVDVVADGAAAVAWVHGAASAGAGVAAGAVAAVAAA